MNLWVASISESRLNLTKQTGLHLGRVLITLADAHHDLINHALNLQEKVRNHEITREEAIDRLYSARRCLEVITHVGHDAITTQSRLGQLLISSGFIQEKDMDLALCAAKRQNRMLGEILVELNWVKKQVVIVALEVQRLIRSEKISIYHGLEQLKNLRKRVGVSEDVPTAPELKEERNLSFYCFLKLANVLPGTDSNAQVASIKQRRMGNTAGRNLARIEEPHRLHHGCRKMCAICSRAAVFFQTTNR